MADNINSVNNWDDKKCSPLPINEARLKEIKAMEEAEQRLIEDLFSTQDKAPTNTKPTSQKKAIITKKPK